MKRIIEIKTLHNGSHRNQTGNFETVPDGYAVIPDNMETPNFPFGEVVVEEINGIPTVTKWIPGVIPEPEPIPEPVNDELTTDDLAVAILEGVNEV